MDVGAKYLHSSVIRALCSEYSAMRTTVLRDRYLYYALMLNQFTSPLFRKVKEDLPAVNLLSIHGVERILCVLC